MLFDVRAAPTLYTRRSSPVDIYRKRNYDNIIRNSSVLVDYIIVQHID